MVTEQDRQIGGEIVVGTAETTGIIDGAKTRVTGCAIVEMVQIHEVDVITMPAAHL